MIPKKHGKKVFGATMTANERKAMDIEIRKQLAEYTEKNMIELDSVILWVIHEQLGLGPKRLKKFYDGFKVAINELIERYDMENSDLIWLCTHKLKEYGVDVEEWHKEDK